MLPFCCSPLLTLRLTPMFYVLPFDIWLLKVRGLLLFCLYERTNLHLMNGVDSSVAMMVLPLHP